MIEIITSFDWTVLNWIHDTLTCPVLDYLMPKITALGDGGLIWIVTALVLLTSKKYRKYGITLIIGLVMGVLVGNVFLKNFFERSRPSWSDPSITLLISNPTDFSFPSGHTLASAIAATILTMSNKKFGCVAIPLACLIAFSRLYLYVHFPSDVLGAALIGLVIGVSVFFGVRWLISKVSKRSSY
ncbi:phosphatase PAP2 family protein [Anaerocolumna aminovalerica]|jgi:undecaprenyl-diphosphatase|uniref:Undecaprenyl-diphosphatase n=1 Tax=Anaerocolumna aminovalerica TaxID=1527 RepID=A0A1I5GTV6_9FIRM|nr:phosphatase PAP2 family protein [Anaerocolumna aminovalerica]MBU5330939.1 phosphatase PAP2 family protein [Anaerocolumna aminovalerica]SFO39428.1 undecaprenyl-diphosphatase [Anaerocolumna aminovalerica]